MANKKKEVYHVKPLNENKKNIIAALIEEYDIETADDIQEALKDLLGGTIKSMMEAEMDEHLGYENYERMVPRRKELGVITENSKLMFHKIARALLSLRLLRNVRKTFQILTVKLSVCMPEDLQQDKYLSR